ncbi:MAG TPA: DUF3301 domain-containing protein [Gammaproteobacteria bacterium]|nr:DUF3301 domain-containing protein [Gammaproteobacteria bacterium]
MKALLFLAFAAFLVWFWQHSLAIRELAIRRCRRVCEEMNLQFLDQTVALASLMPYFNNGMPGCRRRYNFEFSIGGNDRYRGCIVLSGKTVNQLRLQHPDGDILIDGHQQRQLH